jgi:hypothetical protein
MSPGHSEQPFTARYEALTAALLIALAQTAFCFIGPGTHRPLFWLRVANAATSALVALVLWRLRPSLRRSIIGFLVVAVPLFAVFWLDEAERSAAGALWVPFVGPKMAVLGAALLAPTTTLGLVLIAALTVETGVLAATFHLKGLDGLEGVHGEPWITFVYAGISVGLLVHRHKRLLAERLASRATATAEAMRKQARVFMALRDLSNTPLQTLDVNITLLRDQAPQAALLTERMARAIARLNEMSRLLASQQEQITPGDESLDSLEILKKLPKS